MFSLRRSNPNNALPLLIAGDNNEGLHAISSITEKEKQKMNEFKRRYSMNTHVDRSWEIFYTAVVER